MKKIVGGKELILEECSVVDFIVDFMAHFVGLSILHPEGYSTTDKLANLCRIDKEKRFWM